jgi:YD repeat-containing protein
VALTKKWQYATNYQVINNYVYYVVNKVKESEIDDPNGRIWQCQTTKYDEGAASGVPVPAQGLATTVNTYSSANCAGQTSPLTTTYTGYDSSGNAVEMVDALGAANSSLYSNQGCTLSSAPTIKSSTWTASRYTSCTTYDSLDAQPVQTVNAFGQSNSTLYDTTQQDLPVSTTDPNGQSTTTAYSYDSSGQPITQVSEPLETGSYTLQSTSHSTCAASIPASAQLPTRPCYEMDQNTSLYGGAVSRTFYDALGRKVETRTPGPTPGDDTVVMIVYNDQLHTVWTSEPFQVPAGSGWLDPNTTKDINGNTPAGTTTFYDALGRAIATQDLNYGSSQEPGIACSARLSGTYTSCVNYSSGGMVDIATSVDANGHESRDKAAACICVW